jgi:formylmethanofuran dehydrogenase subunit E
MDSFEILLEGSAREHGHLCPGQVVGVRMAMLGCELIKLNDPRNNLKEIKKLIVYVEIDRCATDAIAYVTGAKLGRRSLKFIDNGIMAATFVNLETDIAVRIASTETSRDLAAQYAPDIIDKRQQQLEGYKRMPEHEMFVIQPVEVDIPIHDMPGPTRFKAVCEQCRAVVRDKKEVFLNGRILCRTCALGGYYTIPK